MIVSISGVSCSGKAQPLRSKVLTPSGWKTMGEIKPGDLVVAGDGSQTRVLGVYPQGTRPVYEVCLDDRTSFLVADNHLNSVIVRKSQTRCKKGVRYQSLVDENCVLTTLELASLLERHKHSNYIKNIFIPSVVVQGTKLELPIHPYLLGVLIGDGSLHNSFGVSLPEEDIRARMAELLDPLGFKLRKKVEDPSNYDYYICRDVSKYPNPWSLHRDTTSLPAQLNAMQLRCKSTEKHIPKPYLLADVATRTSLLQGLFDTDGHVNIVKRLKYVASSYEYCTSSPQLSEDFAFLARSLGLIDTVVPRKSHYIDREGVRHEASVAYYHYLRIPNGFPLASSGKHKARMLLKTRCLPDRRIVDIRPVAPEECQCIYVEADCHTYITDNMTVTHNTSIIERLQEKGFPVITPSASRLASKRSFPSMEAKDRFIFETGHQQLLDAQRIAEATGKPVFLDRSQFDNWTFRYVFGGDLSYEHLFLQDIKVPDYTWILNPADVPFIRDGVRPEDLARRREWHQLMLSKADEQHLAWGVLSGTIKERIQQLLKWLQ